MNRATLTAAMRDQPIGPCGPLLRAGLQALVPFYAAAVALRNATFDAGLRRPHRLPRPVISVGNLTTGGTGKTPMVIELARRLEQMGAHPAVLLRGYRSSSTGPGGGDEAAVLRAELGPAIPVVADPSRFRGAQTALTTDPAIDVFLLDDGFQHRQVFRDLDVVLMDVTAPPPSPDPCYPRSKARLLPRGFLREPARSLRRAHAVIVTRADLAPSEVLAHLDALIARLHGKPPLAHAAHRWTALRDETGQTLPVEHLHGHKILAVCGIANPVAFLTGFAVQPGDGPCETMDFPDHHAYTAKDLEQIVAHADRTHCTAILTTEKDWVKWRRVVGGKPRDTSSLPIFRPILTIEFLDGGSAVTNLLRTAWSPPPSRASLPS